MAWLVEAGTTELYRKEIEKTQIWQELDIRNSQQTHRTAAVSECLLIIILTVGTRVLVILTDYQYTTVQTCMFVIVVISNIEGPGVKYLQVAS